MSLLKTVWATRVTDSLTSITLESADPQIPITITELSFPRVPTVNRPLRHTVNIGLFSQEDVDALAELLDTIRS